MHQPVSIMAVQAVDDRIQLLRRPPSYFSANFTVSMINFMILETSGLKSVQIAQDITKHLARFLLWLDHNAQWSRNRC